MIFFMLVFSKMSDLQFLHNEHKQKNRHFIAVFPPINTGFLVLFIFLSVIAWRHPNRFLECANE
jgi:hypothetical protein